MTKILTPQQKAANKKARENKNGYENDPLYIGAITVRKQQAERIQKLENEVEMLNKIIEETQRMKHNFGELKRDNSELHFKFPKDNNKAVSINILSICNGTGVKNPCAMSTKELANLAIHIKDIYQLAD